MIRHGLLFGCIALAACASETPTPIAGPPDGLKIAIAGPLSGPYARFGDEMTAGARQATEDINTSGGVLGQSLTLYALDDRCEDRAAKSAANQAVNAGIVFVAGHFCSRSSIPASEVYAEQSVLQISPASTEPRLTERGLDNVFRVAGRDDQQAQVAADYVADQEIWKNIAIINDRSDYGRTMAENFGLELRRRGLTPVVDRSITPGASDYSELIDDLLAHDADLVYLGGYPTEAGRVMSQARARGLRIRLVGTDAIYADEYWRIAGEAGQDTLFTYGPDPTRRPSATAVASKLRARGGDPGGYALYTYAAIQVFAQAAEQAGTTNLPAVSRALHSGTFDTVLGPLSFDGKGDVRGTNYVLYRWDRGAAVPLS